MKRLLPSLVALLLAASPLWAVDLKLPAEVKGDVGAFVSVPAETTGKTVSWRAVDPGLNLFPVALLKDSKTAVVTSAKAGRYRLWAVTAEGDAPSAIAECVVVIGDAPPPVPPGPTPPGPVPPGPSPIPVAGFRVLVVEDVAARTKLPAGQLKALFDSSVIGYLDAHCVKGADGKTPEWRRWDAGTDPSGDESHWADALKQVPTDKSKLPYIVVSNGKGGFVGPYPATVADTLALLKKYAE